MTGTVHVVELAVAGGSTAEEYELARATLAVAEAARELCRLNVGLVELTIAGSPESLIAEHEARVEQAGQALAVAQAAAEL